MFVIFNVIIIGLVALIAYWWANQGLFSAILHLLCVVVAGAVALAFWEPITVGLVLKGTAFDPYAWGIILVGLFTVTLLVLRVISDKLAPANVDLPHWANLGPGLVVGAMSGTLTMGIFLIGAGHVQAPRKIMGYNGVQRNERGEIGNVNKMLFPVATITAKFYEYLSTTTMLSPNPLARVDPDLDTQATLLRDSYNNGVGQFSLAPKAARVSKAVRENNRLLVDMTFQNAARDYNEQLTLSQSQVRLISTRGQVLHPDSWVQAEGEFAFETLTFYATSTPGQQSATLGFKFNLPTGFDPATIQVKGTRFAIGNVTRGSVSNNTTVAVENVEISPTAPNIDAEIKVDNGIRPVRISRNNMPAGIDHDDGWLTIGDGVFPSQGGSVRSGNAIHGIYQPEGTRIVKVRVDPGSSANIFSQALTERVPARAQIGLVDTDNKVYNPIGYMHRRPDRSYRIKLDSNNFVRERKDLPLVPSTGGEELYLLFAITEGRTLKGLKFGDETIGRCNVLVEADD